MTRSMEDDAPGAAFKPRWRSRTLQNASKTLLNASAWIHGRRRAKRTTINRKKESGMDQKESGTAPEERVPLKMTREPRNAARRGSPSGNENAGAYGNDAGGLQPVEESTGRLQPQ